MQVRTGKTFYSDTVSTRQTRYLTTKSPICNKEIEILTNEFVRNPPTIDPQHPSLSNVSQRNSDCLGLPIVIFTTSRQEAS